MMDIYVIHTWRVELDDALRVIPEQGLDNAHLIP